MDLRYADSVFINCPFDKQYAPLFRAIVFAVHDLGFLARCSLEVSDAAQNRYQKLLDIVAECRYGIHDISRTEAGKYGLPRFNMPLELGIFLGCKAFGEEQHRGKSTLILDRRPYRYQRFISDIAGQDVFSHGDSPSRAIRVVRDWLRTASRRQRIPGGDAVADRYRRFRRQLPDISQGLSLRMDDMPFLDYSQIVRDWLGIDAP